MVLVVDDTHLGTSEEAWLARLERTRVKELEPCSVRRIVVISPHPDDEVLGAGGLIEKALRERVLVEVVAVSDGESSHPASHSDVAPRLAHVRAEESRVALRRLGGNESMISQLHLPDGKIAQHRRELDHALSNVLLPDDLCVAPWRADGHPDHNVTGEAALQASRNVGAKYLGYLVWAWHWAEPQGDDIPWSRCRRLDLGRRARARKRWAIEAFESQIKSIGPTADDAPILPAPVLRRFWRRFEIFIDETDSDV